MPRFPSLGHEATVPDILRMSPDAGVALIEMHDAIMRGPSPLSAGERELIAAYVSGLNDCRYCHGVHAETARAFGIADAVVDNLRVDLEAAGLDPKLRPLLDIARKLTEAPASVADLDIEAALAAGWDETAVHHAILVTCCFNFMNRLLEGHGVHGHEALYKQRGPMLKKHGYLPLNRIIRPKARRSAAE